MIHIVTYFPTFFDRTGDNISNKNENRQLRGDFHQLFGFFNTNIEQQDLCTHQFLICEMCYDTVEVQPQFEWIRFNISGVT